MSGFTAVDAVVALDWDFHPYIEAKGTAPEPSQAKLDAYARMLMGIFAELKIDLPATASEDDIDAALAVSIGADRPMSEVVPDIEAMTVRIRKARIKAASAVCSGKPTIEQITKLPPRVREAFLGWVAGWASEDPTPRQPATNSSRAISTNGAHAT